MQIDTSDYIANSLEQPLVIEQEQKAISKIKMRKTSIRPMKWEDLAIFKNTFFLHAFMLLAITYLYPHLGLFSFKTIGLSNLDDSWITTSGIVGSLFNAFSRLVIGLCYNRFGYAACAFFIMFVEITSSLILVPSV